MLNLTEKLFSYDEGQYTATVFEDDEFARNNNRIAPGLYARKNSTDNYILRVKIKDKGIVSVYITEVGFQIFCNTILKNLPATEGVSPLDILEHCLTHEFPIYRVVSEYTGANGLPACALQWAFRAPINADAPEEGTL